MTPIKLEDIVVAKYPHVLQSYPPLLIASIIKLAEKILRLDEINRFLLRHREVYGLDLIDEIFEDLDFSYFISNKDRQKIPAEGRCICIANHPLGGLDGLAIVKAIGEIRSDVKIIANDVLMSLENLCGLFLPYDLESHKPQKKNLAQMAQALQDEMAVVIFPSPAVSRLHWEGIRDGAWQAGAIYFARKCEAPILPIFVKGRNSVLFYVISLLHEKLSTLFLARETLNKKAKTITLKIGDPIPAKSFSANVIKPKTGIRLLKKHVYALGQNKKGIFRTEKTIAHPVNRKTLKSELADAKLLGATTDGKQILLARTAQAPAVMREIARLRELTFRKVGEGTGRKLDNDEFDPHYQHLVLWDEADLEIVGAYRLGLGADILAQRGPAGFYTATLFDYSERLLPMLHNAIELGRSFVQQRYWKSNALDYLWQGIGAFLQHHPNLQFLFGPVSISNAYSDDAKNMLVYFYRKWFGDQGGLAKAKNPFVLPMRAENDLRNRFASRHYAEDLKMLKESLRYYGFTVPILYKQYSELCEAGGVRFLDFGVDPDFANCVDGLILVQIALLKPAKKARYLRGNRGMEDSEQAKTWNAKTG